MILYLDTSALVKLYVSEEHSAKVAAALRRAELAATSRLAYPEARAALARRHREGGISKPGLRRAVRALDRDFPAFVVIDPAERLSRMAGALAERRGLRGSDAIHLASALELGGLLGESPEFMTFDERQADAALSEGLLLAGNAQ